MWRVTLEKEPLNKWYAGYFPCRFHLKRDAEYVQWEVERMGGKVKIEEVPPHLSISQANRANWKGQRHEELR